MALFSEANYGTNVTAVLEALNPKTSKNGKAGSTMVLVAGGTKYFHWWPEFKVQKFTDGYGRSPVGSTFEVTIGPSSFNGRPDIVNMVDTGAAPVTAQAAVASTTGTVGATAPTAEQVAAAQAIVAQSQAAQTGATQTQELSFP